MGVIDKVDSRHVIIGQLDPHNFRIGQPQHAIAVARQGLGCLERANRLPRAWHACKPRRVACRQLPNEVRSLG